LSAAEETRRLARREPFAWRLSLAAARADLGAGWDRLSFHEQGQGEIPADPSAAGDVVLARKDVGVAYHLAVVLDDALQGITQVVRGQDLFEATPIQRLLQDLLGLPAPTYRHHQLLTGPDGRRYAKRDNAQTLRELRAAGTTAEALRGELGF
jgi:glutamyl-Q tRNA(Asp) synthetase